MVVGLVPGIIGAIVVGSLSTDLVPDGIEVALGSWVVVGVSIGMIGLTFRSLAHR
jgi:hypothetical protein